MLFFLILLWITPFSVHAEILSGIIYGKYANIRNIPSVINSRIVTRVNRGTLLKILEKTQEKTVIENIEGYWFKVEIIEEGIEGWVFDKYVALEGTPLIEEYIKGMGSSLYYYRSDLDDELADIKKNLNRGHAFETLKKYNSRFLNYLGYKLLIERNALALPLLIAFMDPAYQEENSKDANYVFTWELLERLTPQVLITNTYKSFRYWWEKNWGTAAINIPSYEMAIIFKKIQENENRVYRQLTNTP